MPTPNDQSDSTSIPNRELIEKLSRYHFLEPERRIFLLDFGFLARREPVPKRTHPPRSI